MDSNMNEKLNRFSSVVLSDAQKKRAEIEACNELIRKQKSDEAHTEFLKAAYEKIQAAVTKIRREDNEKVLAAGVNARKELLAVREEIIDNVFGEIKERLISFTKTADYSQWLSRQIVRAVDETGTGEKTVFVRKADIEQVTEIVNSIHDEAGEITVQESSEGLIGGVTVKNNVRGIIADYTFDEILSEKKAEFLSKSGLAIT